MDSVEGGERSPSGAAVASCDGAGGAGLAVGRSTTAPNVMGEFFSVGVAIGRAVGDVDAKCFTVGTAKDGG